MSGGTKLKRGNATSNTGELFPQEVEADPYWKTMRFAAPGAVIRIGTLFSGIGAPEHALHRLGLRSEIQFACDIDPHAKTAYIANHRIPAERWHSDVTKFDGKPFLGKLDLLVGGSPCQSFSMAGHRRGLEDARGTLFYDFARVVSEARPNVFIYENVRGLLTHDSGRTWKTIDEVFTSLGYHHEVEVLNARDFGIPQARERVFVVGFKDRIEGGFRFPNPIPLRTKMSDFLEDTTDSKYFLREKGVKFVTDAEHQRKRYTQVNGDVALCQKANQQSNWHGDFVLELQPDDLLYDEFSFQVREVDEKYYLSDNVSRYVLGTGTKGFYSHPETDRVVARTLLQSMHKMHRAGVDNYVTHKGRIRKLTPRECLRLMGFRDDFKIVVSDTQTYRQAGNSMVVDVLIALLRQMDITRLVSKPNGADLLTSTTVASGA